MIIYISTCVDREMNQDFGSSASPCSRGASAATGAVSGICGGSAWENLGREGTMGAL